jgi:1-deoxy-D-xylulose-5-phosphate reductoisomerase
MVDYVDGSVLAQLGNPDMRTPIAHALARPQRMESGVAPLDFRTLAGLEFEDVDLQRFPALGLAFQAAHAGGTAPALLNAANEIAVQAFLDGRLGFTAIAALCTEALEHLDSGEASDLATVLDADCRAREYALGRIERGFSVA